jgi:uncharacterized protein YsxB (DUF464 family)
MQAIKLNTAVNLTSGLSIPSGSVCVIAEGYADVKSQKDGVIPAQIATFVFASVQALAEGKAPIQGIADFNTTFSGLELSVADYETKSAEVLLITAVFNALDSIYPSQVEQIAI